MFRQFRLSLGIVSFFLLATTLSTAAETKRLIFVTNGNSPFWDTCRSGLETGAKDFKIADSGLKVVMEVNDGTVGGQLSKLRQYATQKDVAAVAISPCDAKNANLAKEMKSLREKGIQVITVDADMDGKLAGDARSFYIGTDNIVGGKVLGTAAKKILASKGVKSGGYVQFVGLKSSDNARARMGGFKEAVGSDYSEKDQMGDEMNLNRARENVRNAIRNHSDLKALVGIWSYNAPAIVDVTTQQGNRDKFVIVTFDAEPAAIKHMADGKIDAMVVQDPFDMGVQTVKLLKAMISKDESVIKEMYPDQGKSGGDIYTTGLRVIAPDKGSPLTADQFDPKTVKFFSLTEFKAWLDQYGLKGS